MNKFKVFVYTPAGSNDALLSIAACRAGGVGVFNAELDALPEQILGHLDYISQMTTGGFGLKLGFWDDLLMMDLIGYSPKGLRWLILDAELLSGCQEPIVELKQSGVGILAEIKTLDWPGSSLEQVVDGLVLKGNESGGFVGENSSFIMLQKWRLHSRLPLYIRGGVTPFVAGACSVLGVKGCVLDSQVLLLDESPFAKRLKPVLGNLSGTETIAVGSSLVGKYFRVLARPGLHVAQTFCSEGDGQNTEALYELAKEKIDWKDSLNGLLPVGQDICFAGDWHKKYGHMAAAFRAIDSAVDERWLQVENGISLLENTPLAQTLGTVLPLVQGPMARVSDCAAFASAVFQGGALPVMALSLLKGKALNALMENTGKALGDNPWGVGFLGFAPQVLLDEQLALAKKYHPRVAIIAGARPDQVATFERAAMVSFLHIPSADLIPLFLQEGARRFIFEGRECGGHIGPLSGFILWSSMVESLLSELSKGKIKGEEIQVLFAGGIHDAFSSALVQAIAAPLVNKGIGIGLLMGSGYLFTKEIVDTGAIMPVFQQEVLQCEHTVTLESAPGHVSRCSYTPFAQFFLRKRRELFEKNTPSHDVRTMLDGLVMGKLRIAAKGCDRMNGTTRLTSFDETYQKREGMYMLGQLATLRAEVTNISTLHREVIKDANRLLAACVKEKMPVSAIPGKPADIAVIGVSSVLPKSKTTQDFWENILLKINAITKIPSHRWDWHLYYDKDRYAKDKIYSKWGGFLDDFVFDPTQYGIPPNSIKSIDPMQLMALDIAQQAIVDAGYDKRPFDREKASVIIGNSASGDVGVQYGLRAELPRFMGNLPDSVAERLPEWSEDTFAGILSNVVAGRISNRLNMGGVNFTIDAACASSMAAIYQGVNDLSAGRSDLVIAGGVDTVQTPFSYMCFSKTQALSPQGKCNTFDASSDGIVLAEGIAMVVLKRLEDAERDGDRIYSIIKGVGSSSDGKAMGLTAPLPAGQLLCMRRAYEQAGFSPNTVEMFEAHGTGTIAGDTAELESTTRLLKETGSRAHQAMIGSVKTMIGHTKATAGIVGLIKATLALHHRVLPPHYGVKKPNQMLQEADSPLYLVDEAMPWLAQKKQPRRASVSAFGFGGTNFHIVLEECTSEYRPWVRSAVGDRWPAELLLWSAPDRNALMDQLKDLQRQRGKIKNIELRDLAYNLSKRWKRGSETIAIVARDLNDLLKKIHGTLRYMDSQISSLPLGVYSNECCENDGKLAVLFSGQGAQYTGMLRELAVYFPVLSEVISEADEVLADPFNRRFGDGKRLSHFIYPRATYDDQAQSNAARELTGTDVAQPALGAVEAGLWKLMLTLGLKPDMLGGHSYGEFVALFAGGVFDFDILMSLSEARGRFIVDTSKDDGSDLGRMFAINASRDYVEKELFGIDNVVIANHNAPEQIIISGSTSAIREAMEKFSDAKILVTEIPVLTAFHSPFVAPAQSALADLIEKNIWRDYKIPVYSNTTGKRHSQKSHEIKAVMLDHLVMPVEFVKQIETMYHDGARVFLEIGPKSIQTDLVSNILGKRPHHAIAIDGHGGGITGLLHVMGQLLCSGIGLDPMKLFDGRSCLNGDPRHLSKMQRSVPVPEHAWMLNGGCARRAKDPIIKDVIREDDSARCSPRVIQEEPLSSSTQLNNNMQNRSLRTKTYHKEEKSLVNNKRPPAHSDPGVMAEYFGMMRQFLETQEKVMSMYMDGKSLEQGTGHRQAQNRRQTFLKHSFAEQGMEAPPCGVSVQPEIIGAEISENPGQINEVANLPEAKDPQFVLSGLEDTSKQEISVNGPAAGIDREKMIDMLLTIVEDKTGYPREMIALDQKLETDLGIDSIKRTQIIGGFLKELPQNLSQMIDEEKRTSLSTKTTLDGILDLLCKVCLEGENTVPFLNAGMEYMTDTSSHPFRHIIEPKVESIDVYADRRLEKGHFLITQDKIGVTEKLSKILMSHGCIPCIVEQDVLADESKLNLWCASMESQIENVCGIIHLAQIGSDWIQTNAPVKDWRNQLQLNEKSLFILLHHFSDKLNADAHVLSASVLGGFFNRNTTSISGLSLQSGAVGLLKSLLQERPTLRVKAIDLDSEQGDDQMVSSLMNELEIIGGRQEVGYPKGERTIFKTVPLAVEKGEDDLSGMADLVIFATGGTKGITAELLREFALPGNTLLLTGRSVLPENTFQELASLKTSSELREHFVTEVRNGNLKQTPSEIEKKIKNILSNREMLSNIKDFQARGANVEYYAVDATNDGAMHLLLDDLYHRHKRINGVIHGAGIIEDKLLQDKSSQSWSRVVETKVIGLLLLQKYLRPKFLKFFSVLSSVAGRYGNSGQSDYATANELMNRLCCQLSVNWGHLVKFKSFCWGPWGATTFGVGMVTKDTENKFAERGVKLVRPDVGRALVRDELLYGSGDHIEIVCGVGPWEQREDALGCIQKKNQPVTGNEIQWPLLNHAIVSDISKGAHVITFPLGENHAYLQDHYLDDVPVLPAAVALEIMSEAVAHFWPDHFIVQACDCKLLKGIQLKEPDPELRVVLSSPTHYDNGFQVNVAIESEKNNGKRRIHYRSILHLGKQFPAGIKNKPILHTEKMVSIEKAYNEWLFHGPKFQVIRKIYGLSEGGCRASLRSSLPEQWLQKVKNGHNQWVFDPAVVDAAAQMAILWTRSFRNETALPTRFGRIIRYSEHLPEQLFMQFVINSSDEFHSIHANVSFSDGDDNVLLLIEDMECVSSLELNRLAGFVKLSPKFTT